jgi:hypothetical protein
LARTIIIGDVHGCADELSELLNRLAPTRDDRVHFVGDLVARGPKSRDVLRIVREIGGRAVRGNHEERLIAAHHIHKTKGSPPKLGPSHAAVFTQLDDEDWAQLEALPLKLDLPERELRIVHAGVVPGLPWERQDPWMITHIRSLDADLAPSERWGRYWGELYVGPPHVVFGHNAQRAPQLHRDATGIDTACVYGGALTALVLDDVGPIPPAPDRTAVLVSVPARRAYSDYGRELPGS